MGFDINTDEAQRFMAHQKEALDLFVSRFPNLTYQQTATNGDNAFAVCDAIFSKNNEIFFITEVKTRYVSHTKFMDTYDNQWLLSLKKIDDCRKLADLMKVPLWGFMYLEPDKTLLYIKIYDPKENGFVCNMKIEKATTKGPMINDVKTEPCAFIDMQKSYIIKGE